MTSESQQHLNKALRYLQSVESRAQSDDPDTVISTAYYAMHHAAPSFDRSHALTARDQAIRFVAYCRSLQRKGRSA
jgi:uncharacterized protein (UPF0332 family)